MRHSEAKRRRKARKVMQQLLHSKATFPYWRAQSVSVSDAERIAMADKLRLSLSRIWKDCAKGSPE